MSGPIAPEAVSHVRHDLRTFVNHILGYSEMLLEIARDDGLDALIAPLEDIRQRGRTLLEAIGVALPPTRTDVTLADYRALADQLHPQIHALEDKTTAVLETAVGLGR